jgi:hypothetical protein
MRSLGKCVAHLITMSPRRKPRDAGCWNQFRSTVIATTWIASWKIVDEVKFTRLVVIVTRLLDASTAMKTKPKRR